MLDSWLHGQNLETYLRASVSETARTLIISGVTILSNNPYPIGLVDFMGMPILAERLEDEQESVSVPCEPL